MEAWLLRTLRVILSSVTDHRRKLEMRLALRFPTLFAGFLTAVLLSLGILNLQQQSSYQIPEDGVSWADSADGVKAWIVSADGPGYRAGIREGDLLSVVNGVAIRRGSDATREVFRNGVWSRLVYDLVRQGKDRKSTRLNSSHMSISY